MVSDDDDAPLKAGSSSFATADVPPPRTFEPYATCTRDAPMFQMMLDPCCQPSLFKRMLAGLYRVRWLMSHPLRTPLIPKWVPLLLPSCRFLDAVVNVTVGELVLVAPLIILMLQGYSATFVDPHLENSGYYAAYAIFYTFVTANKANSIFSFLFGIPFERMIALHWLSSLFAVVLGCFHTYVSYKYGGGDDSKFASFEETANLGKYLVDGKTNTSGTCILGFLMGLVAFSLFPIVRRVLFNLWLCSHILLAVGVVVGLFLHGVNSAVFVTMWWGLDLLVRYGIMAGCRYRGKARLRRIGEDDHDERGSNEPAIEISFPKPAGFDYNPGQFVQIALPKLSIFEFHPVSISSAPHEEVVTLHIRKLGDWTSKLVALTDNKADDNWTTTAEVWMEGPYGSLSVDLDDDDRYKMALFVSGGIGVTPCQSIGKSLLYQHRVLGRKLKHFKFVWAVRNKKMVEDIPPLGGSENFSRNSILFRRQTEIIRRSSTSGSFASQDAFNGRSGSIAITERRRSSTGRKLPAVVQVDIHCTRGENDEENNEDGASLPYNLYHGRPDIDALFVEMKQAALDIGEHNVAVFGCGPNSLMKSLREACRRHSQPVIGCGGGVFFDLHTEHFEF